MSDALLDGPRAVMKLGRKRTLHLPRVLIEDQAVVIRTRCGLDPLADGFTETFGLPTCETCIADETGVET